MPFKNRGAEYRTTIIGPLTFKGIGVRYHSDVTHEHDIAAYENGHYLCTVTIDQDGRRRISTIRTNIELNDATRSVILNHQTITHWVPANHDNLDADTVQETTPPYRDQAPFLTLTLTNQTTGHESTHPIPHKDASALSQWYANKSQSLLQDLPQQLKDIIGRVVAAYLDTSIGLSPTPTEHPMTRTMFDEWIADLARQVQSAGLEDVVYDFVDALPVIKNRSQQETILALLTIQEAERAYEQTIEDIIELIRQARTLSDLEGGLRPHSTAVFYALSNAIEAILDKK